MKFSPLCTSLFIAEDSTVLAHGVKRLRKVMSYANGYETVFHKGRKFYVHRLVASAYCAGFSPGKCVNHINGNKLDNSPGNLEWVTQADNIRHAYRAGLMTSQSGSSNTMSKFSDDTIKAVFSMRTQGALQREIASSLGMAPAYVSQILSGKRRAAK